MDRTINFGKYKGTPVKSLILNHIVYIAWCLDNVVWFKLSNEEQTLYNLCAEAIIDFYPTSTWQKSAIERHMTFKSNDTPFVYKGGQITCERSHPLYNTIARYINPSEFRSLSNNNDKTEA